MHKLKEDVAEFWDTNPCAGDGDYRGRLNWLKSREGYIFEILNEAKVRDKRCLEVGCGQGFVAVHVAQWAREVVAVDISTSSLSQASKGLQELEIGNVKLVNGDAENLDFDDDSFDFVYSIGVLHHTQDTQKGIDSVHRVLKADQKAVIMLYRKYCPKGLATLMIRGFSAIMDKIFRKPFYINSLLLKHYAKTPRGHHGTALNELFGCPILKMYSKKQLLKMFKHFEEIRITAHQPGFSRLTDFLPFTRAKWISSLLDAIDRKTKNSFGFYWVIEVRK